MPRTAKEDFELQGKRIRQGQTIMASILYAKACDPRVSAGDHADVALPLHMDIHQLHASFRPERWLNKANNLDQAVRLDWHTLDVETRPRMTGMGSFHAAINIKPSPSDTCWWKA